MRLIAASTLRNAAFRRAAAAVGPGAAFSSKSARTKTCACRSTAPILLVASSAHAHAYRHPAGGNKPSRQLRHLHVSSPSRSASSSSDAHAPSLQERGILDSDNLLQFATLYELQTNASTAFAANELFGTYTSYEGNKKDKSGSGGKGGEFKWMTYEEWGRRVETCRTVLKNVCGISPHSKIGIISNNRWEWPTIAAAAYSLNATLAPMYEAQLPKDWTYILNDSECTALFCANEDIHHRARKEVLPDTPSVKSTLCLDAALGEPHAFASAMATAAADAPVVSPVIKPTPDDLANLVYTSGTTGKPKGVELLHSNTVSNILGVRTMVEDPHDFIRKSDRSLAFLPWAHSYGQTCELWSAVAHGSSMGIGRGVPYILDDLASVRPTILFAVPTLYKRIYDGVHNMMENSSPLRKILMKKALTLGRKKALAKLNPGGGQHEPMSVWEQMQFSVLNGIVLKKIRGRFGGRLRHGFVAGAACPKAIIDFMDDIGIPVCEGYGLTETSPIITLNTPYYRKPGSCGRPLTGVKVVILDKDGTPAAPGEEGEICCYGPNVMRGYHKKPEATAEAITLIPADEGGGGNSDSLARLFHTGDLGRMGELTGISSTSDDDDEWVRITGRLKEQYKLQDGKYVCPTPIEEAIGMSRFISQVVICGANRPNNVALVVPDWAAIRSELKVEDETVSEEEEDLAIDDRVRSLIHDEIQSKCFGLKKFEIPTDFIFVAPFTAANHMLTPKMSIRRHMVICAYEDEIAKMYGDEDIIANEDPVDGAHHEKSEKAA